MSRRAACASSCAADLGRRARAPSRGSRSGAPRGRARRTRRGAWRGSRRRPITTISPRREHPVADGRSPAFDAEERQRNDQPVEERDDAADRAGRSARVAVAPAHHLREGQPRDDRRQDLGEHLRRRRARGSSCARRRYAPFGESTTTEVRDVDLLRLREALGRLRRLAVLAEGARRRRARGPRRDRSSCCSGSPRSDEDEPPRRGVATRPRRARAAPPRARPRRARASSSRAGSSAGAGISSVRISRRSLGVHWRCSPPATCSRRLVTLGAAQTAAGSGSESGNRCPSSPET